MCMDAKDAAAATRRAETETFCPAHQQLHGAAVADRSSVMGEVLRLRGRHFQGQIRTRPLAMRIGSIIMLTLVEAGRVALLGAACFRELSAEGRTGAKADADAAKATSSAV